MNKETYIISALTYTFNRFKVCVLIKYCKYIYRSDDDSINFKQVKLNLAYVTDTELTNYDFKQFVLFFLFVIEINANWLNLSLSFP